MSADESSHPTDPASARVVAATDDPPRAAAVVEHVAERLGGRLRGRIELSRTAVVDNPALHHIAHYSSGSMLDFDVDVLSHPALSAGKAPDDVAALRELCRKAGQGVAFTVSRFDPQLQQLGTGDLIRAVLQGPEGAICCNSVVPGTYVIAATIFADGVGSADVLPPRLAQMESADRAVAALVTEMRARIRQGPQNPGGWATEDLRRALAVADSNGEGLGPLPPSSNVAPHLAGNPAEPATALCRSTIDRGELHYVAHYRNGAMAFSIDRLDDERLEEFFVHVTVERRRKGYREVGRRLSDRVGDMDRRVRPLLGGPLARVVLDVEQGAIFYYRIRPAEYLLGVTLDQSTVSTADDALARIAATCQ